MIFFTHCYTISFNGGNYKCLSPPSSTAPSTHQPDLSPSVPSVDITGSGISQSDLLLELEEIEGHGGAVEVMTSEIRQLLGGEVEVEVEVADEEDNQGLLE